MNSIVDYWIEIKSVHQRYEKYGIFNIANEWMGTWYGSDWASVYQAAIPDLRNAGITANKKGEHFCSP